LDSQEAVRPSGGEKKEGGPKTETDSLLTKGTKMLSFADNTKKAEMIKLQSMMMVT